MVGCRYGLLLVRAGCSSLSLVQGRVACGDGDMDSAVTCAVSLQLEACHDSADFNCRAGLGEWGECLLHLMMEVADVPQALDGAA
ncbi:hypothetical protein Dimus_028580 [Dionaea muscipula]